MPFEEFVCPTNAKGFVYESTNDATKIPNHCSGHNSITSRKYRLKNAEKEKEKESVAITCRKKRFIF